MKQGHHNAYPVTFFLKNPTRAPVRSTYGMTKMPTFHLTQWPHVRVAFLLVIMRDSCMLVMQKEMMCSAHETPPHIIRSSCKESWVTQRAFIPDRQWGSWGRRTTCGLFLWLLFFLHGIASGWVQRLTRLYTATSNVCCASQTFHMHMLSEKE